MIPGGDTFVGVYEWADSRAALNHHADTDEAEEVEAA